MTTTLWLLPVLLPLLAAGTVGPVAARWRPVVLCGAALPALMLAVTGAPGAPPDLSWLLFDPLLGLDEVGRLLLLLAGLVWALAGASAGEPAAQKGFATLWLVTMSGSITLLLAADVVTLYLGFAVMTYAAYRLIVHDRDHAARRAARAYMAVAVIGEVLLLCGLMLAVGAAGQTTVTAVADTIAASDHGGLIAGLLVAGFGVKAGLVPLHLWLPVAHPAAPVAASAALSGVMIKAGVLGWLRVLPLEGPGLEAVGTTLVVLGLLGAGGGIVLGLLQTHAKVMLAYSSVSQIGMIALGVGAGLVTGVEAATANAAAIYALHHGLAKALLFLGVGVAGHESRPARRAMLVTVMGLAAASLAGLPPTSGAAAKIALEEPVEVLGAPVGETVAFLLSLLAVGTTLLMVRVLRRLPHPRAGARAAPATTGALLVAAVAVAGATWWAALAWVDSPEVGLYPQAVVEGIWPVVVGLVLAAAAHGLRRRHDTRLPVVEAGDLLVPVERAARWGAQAWAVTSAPVVARGRAGLQALRDTARRSAQPGHGVHRLEAWLRRWRSTGVMVLLVAIGLGLALLVPVLSR